MKRLTLVILILGIPGVVSAGSWLDTRAKYYTAMRMKLGYVATASGLAPTAHCSLLWSEAASIILPINKGIKKLTEVVTSYRQATYTLDSTIIDIEAVFYDSSGMLKPLEYLPIKLWGKVPHLETGGTPNPELARPSFYDYTDSVLLIYPTQTGHTWKDTLTIVAWHRLDGVDTVTVSRDIPEQYRAAILYHMVWNHAKARKDSRAEEFRAELALALSQIGLKLLAGGQVVEAGK